MSMTTPSQQPPVPYPHVQSPLARCLIALAGTPDDASWVERRLVTIAQLSADLITPVAYASVTAYRLGVRASLSIPLFAGRGTALAALNLYGRHPAALAPLTAAVWATYDPE